MINRQRCKCKTCDVTFIPFHSILPATGNIYITEELRERGCFHIKEDPYRRSHELLGYETGDPDVISQREMENWAVTEGKRIRLLELHEAKEKLAANNIDSEEIVQLIKNNVKPDEVYGSVDGAATPPLSLNPAEVPLEIAENAIKGSIDGVLVRKQKKKKHHIELAVADIRDTDRAYNLSDFSWSSFILKFLAVLLQWSAIDRPVVLFVDGAKQLKTIFEVLRFYFPQVYMILDWYHLVKKCKERLSMACHGKDHRNQWLRIITRLLWHGKVDQAIWNLRKLKLEAKNKKQVDQLIGYLQRNQAFIPNYMRRKELSLTNGSHRGEKACDLLVAKRMKNDSIFWNKDGADAICALRTISRNGEWDMYFAPKLSNAA